MLIACEPARNFSQQAPPAEAATFFVERRWQSSARAASRRSEHTPHRERPSERATQKRSAASAQRATAAKERMLPDDAEYAVEEIMYH